MDIIVLTFSKEHNFGANLQCYALCKLLTDRGHQVKLLDIQLPHPKPGFPALLYQWIFTYKHSLFRRKYFPPFTPTYKTAEALKKNPPQADLFIVGSDQVWNPQITQKLSVSTYFFDFLPKMTKRIAYAASFGTANWSNDQYTEKVRTLLTRFHRIGVREQSGIDICQNVFDREAKQVLDPTLLLDSYEELYLPKNSKMTNELICLKFVRHLEFYNICREVARDKKLQPVLLNNIRHIKGFRNRAFCSVPRWLDSIRRASYVLTDSFHCMVFAIIFEKPFIVFPAIPERSERMKSLLESLGIANRFCKDYTTFYTRKNELLETPINYSQVKIKLATLKQDSRCFLLNSITE